MRYQLFVPRSAFKAISRNLQRNDSITNIVSMLSIGLVCLLHPLLLVYDADVCTKMVREEGVKSLGRGVTPNVFRSILMNASQLASYVVFPMPYVICIDHLRNLDFCSLHCRYDFFKTELLKTRYFDDNIICHFTASFAAVCLALSNIIDQIKARMTPLGNRGNDRVLPSGCTQGTLGISLNSFQ